MTGYLNSGLCGNGLGGSGLCGNRTGQPGYVNQAAPTGFAWLARDKTALETNDRGWGNLPPWGYARNNADPWRGGRQVPSTLNGLGCGGVCGGLSGACGGACGGSLAGIESVAASAATAYAAAIMTALTTGPSMPNYSNADALVVKIEDPNTREAISGLATGARNQIYNAINYGEDPSPAWMSRAQLEKLASGEAVESVAGDEWTDVDPDKAKTGAESTTWLQDFAMTDAAKKVIQTGAFTAGVTGINKEAILKEGERSDIDVGSLVKLGEKFGNWGKIGLVAAAVGAGYVVAKRLGII